MESSAQAHKLPAKYITNILSVVHNKGGDVASILRDAGVTFDPQTSAAEKVCAEDYARLIRRYAQYSSGSLFGLPAREDSVTAGFSILCQMLVHCDTMEAALRCAEEFYSVFGSPKWRFSVTVQNALVTVSFPRSDSGSSISACDLAAWYRFWGWLTGRHIHLCNVVLNDRSLVDAERPRYSCERLFSCPVVYQSAGHGFSFSTDYLKNPVIHTHRSMNEFLETAPLELITLPREDQDSLEARIRFIIGKDFSKACPSYQEVSRLLHVSPTTLRRRLMEEGTTYQQIKDDVRSEAAIDYLKDSRLSVCEIAYLLGFIDPSAFNRAFKRWTGQPPGEYRQRCEMQLTG